MTSFYDRQSNCLSEPEKGLLWAFLLLRLDPLSPGMTKASYELAWASAGGVGTEREQAFWNALALTNVHIDPFDFVVTLQGVWFDGWIASIAAGESDPVAQCASDVYY